jgi:FlaA1/EpsC-like NDP-sugar epimerase
MSRFWITLDQVASFVVQAIEDMKGGELFIPKIPSATVMGIAKAICPDAEIVTIGIRAGEKLHETLITKEESEHARFDNAKERFEINLMEKSLIAYHNGYCSDTNTDWLTVEKIKEIAE